ncbi:MAG: ABC transporter ATP-binding protein [Anaerolineae bacterium]|nr:ABC transporter ATP-binding protein [Anaerolineae bacterium]
MMDRLRRATRSLWQTALVISGLLVLAVVAELLPPLQAFDAFLKDRPGVSQFLQILTLGMAILGGLMLVLAQFLPAPRHSLSTSQDEAESLSPPLEYDEVKSGSSRSFSGEASFSAVKEAWRLRAWRYDRSWRIFFVMMAGALLMVVGLFGFFVVIGPPLVKLLCGGALLYALGRTAWGFRRA